MTTFGVPKWLLIVVLVAIVSIISTRQQVLLDGILNILDEGEEQIKNEPADVPPQKMRNEYDFIIVGAGTAGCVIANRLTENPNWNVLLIEAGRSENFLMDMPLLANYLQFTEANWAYKTMPSDKYCTGMNNNQCNWPRGKVMGGSSVLNYMIYTRGNRRDYDNWAKMGNTGWSFKEVLPYFMKVENFTAVLPMDHNYHNDNGYLQVDYSPYKTPIADAFINASMQTGIPYVDYNGPKQTGVSRLQLSVRNGVRDSASRAYLHPVSQRPNLHVKKHSMVSKILIDPKTKVAYGVEFVRFGRNYKVLAKKEVIVSAGAINSPQLLMLSGVGPKKHLKQLGIPVLSNLRVGFNLMDHITAGGLTFVIDKPYSIITDRIITRKNLDMYLNHHKGPLALPGGCEVLVFYDFNDPSNPDGYPDIELLVEAGSIPSDPVLKRGFGITDELYNKVYKPLENKDSFMVFPMLMRPLSRGRIMLSDAKYTTKPMIFPNYFAHPKDIETIVKGIKLTVNITQQPAMKALGARLHDIPIPSCSNNPFGSDKYFECMARHFTFTIYHQSGTCKMGPPKDKKAVVDPRLRVYGIRNLRVIDASIIPEIPAAHTNAPTYMIAEKGADMIKEDWRGR